MPEDMDLEKWAHQHRKAYLVESIPISLELGGGFDGSSLDPLGGPLDTLFHSIENPLVHQILVAISKPREKDGSVRGCLAVLAGYWEEEIGWWMGEQ